jgi:hypothetical protein
MFVEMLHGRVADEAGARKEVSRWQEELAAHAAGWLGLTAGATLDHRFVLLHRFESEEAARRSAERPAQIGWRQRLEAYMVGQLAARGYPAARVLKDGACDQAGFVQLMLGRVSDRARLAALEPDVGRMLRERAPHVLGATILDGGDDSSFAQLSYATSEQDVLAAERTMSVETAVLLGMVRSYMEGLEFLDLRDPWLLSPDAPRQPGPVLASG